MNFDLDSISCIDAASTRQADKVNADSVSNHDEDNSYQTLENPELSVNADSSAADDPPATGQCLKDVQLCLSQSSHII